MPISWKGTLQQYVGRLHRLHDNKRFVQVYDYVDNYVPMLARMYERRLKGYGAIGYVIEQETFPPHPPAAAHRKRQSNTTLDAGGDLGYWFRAAQAAGVSSASRWMEMSARPGNTAPR